jgi:hypothetical protein
MTIVHQLSDISIRDLLYPISAGRMSFAPDLVGVSNRHASNPFQDQCTGLAAGTAAAGAPVFFFFAGALPDNSGNCSIMDALLD